MKKKDSEANSEVRIAAAKARAETLERQARERAEFLAGDGIVIRRYTKEATKAHKAYLTKNRRQLEQARKQSQKVRAKEQRRKARASLIAEDKAEAAADVQRRKNYAARELERRKKKTFIFEPEAKAKADKQWAASKARYILLRYSDRHGRPEIVHDNNQPQEQG